MPEQNVRFVVLGSVKADKEFSAFSRGRTASAQEIRKLQRQLEKTNRKTQQALRRIRRPAAGGV